METFAPKRDDLEQAEIRGTRDSSQLEESVTPNGQLSPLSWVQGRIGRVETTFGPAREQGGGASVTATDQIVKELAVKSRHRVKAYGEVFTPRHMVDRMLDLVSEELETGPDFVDQTFLEPAAGHGNFLVAILGRKLRAIEDRCPSESWATESLFAVASIYGIELLEDNHQDAKAVMLAEFHRFHDAHGTPCGPATDLHQAAAFLIETNIARGNTLTGRTPIGEDIQLSWWHRVAGKPGEVQRVPFTLASLRDDGGFDFTVYDTYEACQIEKVHEQEKSDA